MKQGLSLRVSQHLALTPQLQQSIRLLQLSTLEMAQEVEQMLDENPFLERAEESAEREDYGLEQTDAPVSAAEQIADAALPGAEVGIERSAAERDAPTTTEGPDGDALESRIDGDAPLEESWEGDGSVDLAPDDSEWGGDAPARNNAQADDETASATELARASVSLQEHLHEQARCLRLSDEDRAALYFLIESRGNDLSTPRAEWGFPGLKPGDRWCLCAARWLEAYEAGMAPKVVLEATNAAATRIVPVEALREHAV